ncbi:GNAT family N-acetyltransferase [Deinococcus koreensis]|uniref:GNAT family N-acetyltransferase n=1 Tax=Deinococcus koreensis TaxID=2054903 RepID=A0A2K3UV45_9DEIO|nr:GNAT family N-acetyltransferase [Deinococcus koreensis]PNY80402.1 GNAT family N-acetyltransferase [Deinococcus koreensis]
MTDLRTLRPILPPEAALALPALRELRPASPALVSVEALQAHLRLAGAEGYRLVGAFEPGRLEAAAVAGFRSMTTLWDGPMLYVDDLSTLPDARGRGHAGALLSWLDAEALRLDCRGLHLDSGVGEARHTAHRQYLKHGMNIVAHHFQKRLAGQG